MKYLCKGPVAVWGGRQVFLVGTPSQWGPECAAISADYTGTLKTLRAKLVELGLVGSDDIVLWVTQFLAEEPARFVIGGPAGIVGATTPADLWPEIRIGEPIAETEVDMCDGVATVGRSGAMMITAGFHRSFLKNMPGILVLPVDWD